MSISTALKEKKKEKWSDQSTMRLKRTPISPSYAILYKKNPENDCELSGVSKPHQGLQASGATTFGFLMLFHPIPQQKINAPIEAPAAT